MRQHSGKKRLGAVLLSLALCLSLLPTAALAVDSVTYIDAEGNSQTTQSGTEVTGITSSTTNLSAGWYVVTDSVTISGRITVSGEVHLILTDGYTLTASDGITVSTGNSLTIYGQTQGTGALTATCSGDYGAGIGGGNNPQTAGGEACGTVTINGGRVTAEGGTNSAGIGGSSSPSGSGEDGGTVTINGGVVTAKGGQMAAGIGGGGTDTGTGGAGGEVTINGGVVTATGGGNYGTGIGGGGGGGTGGAVGTFSTGENGNAVIFAQSGENAVAISNTSGLGSWQGAIFQGNVGQVYGSVTLSDDVEIPEGYTLTVPSGATLTVAEGVTLTNNGTITKNGGFLFIDGTLAGNGNQPADDRYTIHYEAETITIGAGYAVYTAETGGTQITSGSSITAYIGQSLYIQKTDQETTERTEIEIPARPQAPTLTSASIDFSEEKLSFPPGLTATTLEYATEQTNPEWKDVPSDAALSDMGWNGTAIYLYFRTGATDSAFASEATQSPLTIPARPEAPNALLLMDWTDVSVTYYVGEGVQCRLGNEGAWVTLEQNKTNHTFNNLTPQTTYTIYARKPATESQFASAEATAQVTTKTSAAAAPDVGAATVTDTTITLPYDATWEYSTDQQNWSGIHKFTGLTAATQYTYYVRVAETNTAEASEIATVTVWTAYAPPVAGEGYTIHFDTETLTVEADYEVNTTEDFTGTGIPSGGSLADYTGGTLYIRHKADEGGAPASAAVAITIPARPVAPTVTGGVERIQGATTDMEYRTGDGAWTQFTQATVGRLDPGTYAVRLAATDSAFASAPVTVTVTQYTPPANPNYRVDIPTPEHGTITADPAAAKAGETVTLTPAPDEGYQVGTVTVTDRFGDAVEVTENADGTYTFTMPSGQVKVAVTFVEAAPEPLPFTDVKEGDWFHDAVRYVYDNGLMDGVGDGQFAPNATTNRAMVVTILYRLAGEPAVSGDVAFTDVEPGLWYTDAVLWAAQKGIVNGVNETEFAPAGDLTREQLATILYRYAQDQGYDVSAQADLSGFPDAGDIQDYATKALSWAVAEGLLQGFEDDSLQPAGTATRAQIATILMRFCETVAQ